jgi:hypothetical protein
VKGWGWIWIVVAAVMAAAAAGVMAEAAVVEMGEVVVVAEEEMVAVDSLAVFRGGIPIGGIDRYHALCLSYKQIGSLDMVSNTVPTVRRLVEDLCQIWANFHVLLGELQQSTSSLSFL